MKCQHILVFVLSVLSAASAGETLFTSGPQEFAGRKYYWLAEWKLEVTLPDDTTSDDRFEVFFGSKGAGKRTLYFKYDGKTSSISSSANGFFLHLPKQKVVSILHPVWSYVR